MQEQQVGIEEYTTSTTGFTGILKHRYNDFQVFEVDLAGRTAHLTATEAASQAQQQGAGSSNTAAITEEAITEVVAAFAATAGRANADQLQRLLTNIQQQQQQQQAAAAAANASGQQQQDAAALEMEVDLLPEGNKDVRKAIHQFLKSDSRLPPLATESVAAEGAAAGPDGQVPHHVIRIRRGSGGAAGRGQRGGQDKRGQKRGKREWRDEMSWEGGELKHVKFVMLKENTDTQAALGVVARMLHSQPRSFGFAGTKDKRGVTTQWVTAFKVAPAKLAALNPRLRGIKLGNFEFTGSHLSLGQLGGNHFKVLMRDVSSSDEEHIGSAVSELRCKGFLNYFGLQRFGIGAVATHRVGAALLRGEWQAAVRLIMQGGPGERREYRQARALYMEQGDIQGTLKVLPTSLVAERAVLQGLARNGSNAYLTALQGIPRTLRSMYMHAWQSWLWNRAASERFRRYSADKAVEGDLVLLTTGQQQQQQDGDAAVDALYDAEEQDGQSTAAAVMVAGDAGDDAEGDDVSAAGSAAARLSSVHVVTAAEAAAGKFSIRDVVLPLPGGRVQYPQHEAGWQLYCQMAAADGVMLPGMTAAEFASAAAAAAAEKGAGSANAADVTAAAVTTADAAAEVGAVAGVAAVPASHSAKDFQLAELSGDYRRLLHVPEDMQHQVIRYSNPDEELLQSDWSQLQQQQGEGNREHKRQRCEEQQQQQQQQQLEQQESAAADADNTQVSKDAQQDPEAAAGIEQQQGGTAAGGVGAAAAGGDGSSQRELVAVVLEFTLPSSCYATMLVRELTKSSTSKASQKQLSARA